MVGKRIHLVLVAVMMACSPALAQQSGGNCKTDVKKFCPDVKAGDGRIQACMKSRLAELSEVCEGRVFTVAVSDKVCKGDVAKLCAGIVPGSGGIRECMKSHVADLSEACRNAMSGVIGGRKVLGGGYL